MKVYNVCIVILIIFIGIINVNGEELNFISSFDINDSGNDDSVGVGIDENFIYVGDDSDHKIYKYDKNGLFISSFDIDLNIDPTGVGVDNNFVYIADDSLNKIYIYNKSGTYISLFDLELYGNNNPYGVGIEKNFIYTVDYVTKKVYKYHDNGSYILSFDISFSGNLNPCGLGVGNGFIWIVDNDDIAVYKYYENGTYIMSFNIIDSGNLDPCGAGFYNKIIWVSNDDTDKVYKYLNDDNPECVEISNSLLIINVTIMFLLILFGFLFRESLIVVIFAFCLFMMSFYFINLCYFNFLWYLSIMFAMYYTLISLINMFSK